MIGCLASCDSQAAWLCCGRAIRAEEGSDADVEASGGRRVPIIAVSANVTQEDQDTFTACGMTGFMGKPVKRRQLMELLATHVGKASVSLN